jgi:RNA polymerase sigma factor (sigma-70 family)
VFGDERDWGRAADIPDQRIIFFSASAGNKMTILRVLKIYLIPCRGAQVMVGEDNKARFDALVVPHLAEAVALARWLVSNRADAEDIVQEACLRAFRAIDSFSGGSARAWVLTIVRRTAYSWLSKNRVPTVVAVDDLTPRERTWAERGGDSDATNRATPETELIAKSDAARLEAAIAALPVEFRETFVLRDIQGLDYREIAEVTGTPLGTVMSRLARARRRLIDGVGTEQR